MNIQSDQTRENQMQSVANSVAQKGIGGKSAFQLVDNRPETIVQRKLQEAINSSSQVKKLMAFDQRVKRKNPADQVAQFKSSQNEPIQLLRTATSFNKEIEGAGGVTSNIFFKAITNGLLKFKKAGQPKSIKGRMLHNIYESITGPTQSSSTNKLKALDTIEHSAYRFLNINVGRNTPVSTQLRLLIENLLDEVQQEHQKIISTEISKGRVPYFRGEEALSKQQLAQTHQDWRSIAAGTGSLDINSATAEDKNEKPKGFSNEIFSMLHRTMGSAGGRELVHSINSDDKAVKVYPKHPLSIAMMGGGGTVGETQALATGTLAAPVAGPKQDSILRVEPGMTDTQYPSKDEHGRAILSPAWLLFAHELIHTRHNQLGMNHRKLDGANYVSGMPHEMWSNAEEHATIDLGVPGTNITENSLRAEHGLSKRIGHG
ncbi:MAG: M91 family zinc metallopeptidase [Flavobacterium circumlabens]|uniref:M91 family zinc metallopeptidase n=1 Tax=Flavobacterium circumlabens TaxID=2133765 RepID=UPI00326775B5